MNSRLPSDGGWMFNAQGSRIGSRGHGGHQHHAWRLSAMARSGSVPPYAASTQSILSLCSWPRINVAPRVATVRACCSLPHPSPSPRFGVLHTRPLVMYAAHPRRFPRPSSAARSPSSSLAATWWPWRAPARARPRPSWSRWWSGC